MNLEGRKIVVNKSVNALVEMLNKPEDYKKAQEYIKYLN